MTERQFKRWLAIYVVATDLALVLEIMLRAAGFGPGEMSTVMGMILPVFLGCLSAIMRYLVVERFVAPDNSARVTNVFVGFMFSMVTVAAIGIAVAVYLKTRGNFDPFADFETFKKVLAGLLTVSAICKTQLVYVMLRSEQHPETPPELIAEEAG